MKKYTLTEADLDVLAKAHNKVDQARSELFAEFSKRLQPVTDETPTEPEKPEEPEEPLEPQKPLPYGWDTLAVGWAAGETPRDLDSKIRQALDDMPSERPSKLVVKLDPGGQYDSIDVSGLMFSKNGKNYCGALLLFESVGFTYYGLDASAPVLHGFYGEGPIQEASLHSFSFNGIKLHRGDNAKACVLVKDMALSFERCKIEGDDSGLCMWGIHSYRTPLYVDSCRFYNFREHAIYAHHCPSATVELNTAFDCGRTAFQFARRGTQDELPEAVRKHGKLRVAYNSISRIGKDVPNGNGSAITFYGASRASLIEVENNRITDSHSGGIAILPEPGWNAVSQSNKLVWAAKQGFDVKSFKKDEGLFSGTDADAANSAWKNPQDRHWLQFGPQWWATPNFAIADVSIFDNKIVVQTNRAVVEVSGARNLSTDVKSEHLIAPSQWAVSSCHLFLPTTVSTFSGPGEADVESGGGEI